MAFESPDIQRKTPLGRNFDGYIRKKTTSTQSTLFWSLIAVFQYTLIF